MSAPLSFSYYGSRAGQAIDQAISQVQRLLRGLGNTVLGATYGLRQEVPFERWFLDHGFQTPIDTLSDQMKARGWATLSVAEGSLRTLAEATCYVFSKVFEPSHSDRHLDVLKAQWTGLRLSLLAIASPNWAKSEADNNGNPIIGCSILDWSWGTLYTGKLDISPWRIECSQYPWTT